MTPHRFEYVLLACLALLWGSSYALIDTALHDLPPLTLITARVSIAAGVLALVMRWRRQPWPRGHRTWGRLAIQSVLNSIGIL